MADRKSILDYVYKTYGTQPESLWAKTPNQVVLRHKDNPKWYGIIMDIPRQKIGLQGDGLIDILDVKCMPEMISALAGQKGFAPAYHMNKAHWISILLDNTLKDDVIYNLLDISYQMTGKPEPGHVKAT